MENVERDVEAAMPYGRARAPSSRAGRRMVRPYTVSGAR